ncbi:hypothetical protein RRJ93_004453 [Vibrio parahaemolyticus]|nr:hypothetical protein [Vibrio parahaemolyticus]ELI5426391.1 hypothetical protein [Vibrio parahaemolyticus]
MTISWLEIFSIVSSLVSLIIGGFAIWLSVQFYKMSARSSEKLEQSSNNISNATERLEMLFDKLYSDTFSMVKDTMNDMRQHVWNSDSVLSKEEDRINKLREDLTKEINAELSNKLNGQNIPNIESKIEELVGKALHNSVSYESEQGSVQLLETITRFANTGRKITLTSLCDHLSVEEDSIVGNLFRFKREGVIDWSGSSLSGNTPITFIGSKS